MTISPGTLILHRLKVFDIFTTPIIDSKDYHAGVTGYTLSPYQIINIPFIRDFLVSLSFPSLYLSFFIYSVIQPNRGPKPDFLLLFISLFLTFYSCGKLIWKQTLQSLKKYAMFLTGLTCISIPILIKFDTSNVFPGNTKYWVYLLIIIQSCFLSVSPATASSCQEKYAHPKAELLSVEGYHPLLRKIYSTWVGALMFVWHHIDLVTLVAFSGVYTLYGMRKASYLLVTGAIISSFLSAFVISMLLQLSMLQLMLPIFYVQKSSEDEKPKKNLKSLLQPFGEIAFGLSALPICQLLWCYAWCHSVYMDTKPKWHRDFFFTMILSGTIMSAFSRVFSCVHNVKNGDFRMY